MTSKNNLVKNTLNKIVKSVFYFIKVMISIYLFLLIPPVHSQNTNNKNITYKIISSSDKTFGYDILLDGKTYIHQENIPSMPGTIGFKTKEQAQKCALLAIAKIKKHIMPPSVTRQDLISLNIIDNKK